MRDEPAPVGLVVIGGDAEDGVDAKRGCALGQVHRVAGVVGPDPRGDRRALGPVGDRQLNDAQMLLVGQRGGLAGRAADDEAVRAVLSKVVQKIDERLLVDVQIVVKWRDDCGEDGSQPGHVRHCPRISPQAGRHW